MGEWISVQSSRELSRHQLEIEAREIEAVPEEEREELALIYQAKGLGAEQARGSRRGRCATAQRRSTRSPARSWASTPAELGGSAWVAAGDVVRALLPSARSCRSRRTCR